MVEIITRERVEIQFSLQTYLQTKLKRKGLRARRPSPLINILKWQMIDAFSLFSLTLSHLCLSLVVPTPTMERYSSSLTYPLTEWDVTQYSLFCFNSAALVMQNLQQFNCLVKSKLVKQEVSYTVILTPMVNVLCI